MTSKRNLKKSNITLVSMKAIGGDLSFSGEATKGFETFSIPGLHGELYAFEVEGNSMSPNINHGDMLICSKWEENDELREDAAYVVITDDGARVKRVERKFDDNDKFVKWSLISDNPDNHTRDIEKAEVTHIFYVKKVIVSYSNKINRKQFFSEQKNLVGKTIQVTPKDNKEALRNKISNGRIAEVIKELIDDIDKNDELYNNLLMLKSRIKRFILDRGSGCLSKEEENTELNRITKALLDYIDLLD
jgi:signal peptidase I